MGKKDNSFFLQELHSTHFRNYHHFNIALNSGLNIIVGHNAQGKTNLLEAIHFLSTTKPLKGANDHEMILKDKTKATLQTILSPIETKISVELEIGKPKKIFINHLLTRRTQEVIGRLPSVCFKSSDLSIIQGEPSHRRLFLDLQISQINPAYLQHLTYYKHALAQRNTLLKSNSGSPHIYQELEVWEQILAKNGAAIRNIRSKFIQDINYYAACVHQDLADKEVLNLEYILKDEGNSEELLLKKLAETRKYDLILKSTSKGPHRDDLAISIDQQPGRYYGSLGQQRTALLSMKFGVLTVMEKTLGITPVLLLDDIFSDLDQTRRQKLTEKILTEASQVILTCTEKEQAGTNLTLSSKIFKVAEGKIDLL